MTFIPRILASASNAPKQSHCQTGKSLAVYKNRKRVSIWLRLSLSLRSALKGCSFCFASLQSPSPLSVVPWQMKFGDLFRYCFGFTEVNWT